jgi:dTDP-4-amino-4,6-dideoxygalactose transaminase
MKVRRTVPPTAAPVKLEDLVRGFTGLFSGGQTHRESFEREIKEHFGVERVFCVSSGKAALTLILLALRELSKKCQVVIPAYTCFSVPSSIIKAGLEIVPCDIDPATLDYDYNCLQQVVTDETLCVLAIHLFGIPADLDRIRKLCRDKDIFVVEDAAQAMGGRYKGWMLGTIGDVGFYSLGRGKNITCGSGGIIITGNDAIAAALQRRYAEVEETPFREDIKNFIDVGLMSLFIKPYFYWLPAGLPFLKLGQTFFHADFPIQKLSGRRATLLQNWRERLLESNQTRTRIGADLQKRLVHKDNQELGIPYLRFPLLVGDRQTRDLIYNRSQALGLGLSLMYPTPVNEIAELSSSFSGQFFPAAKRVAETLLTLPTHHLLSETDKANSCHLLDSTLSSAARPAVSSAPQPI